MLRRVHPLVQVVACVSLAVVAGVSASAIGTPRVPLAPPTSSMIAVIDLPKVLDGLKEKQAKDTAIQASAKELEDKGKSLRDGLEAEKKKIELMANGPEKLAAAKAFREKALRADFDMDFGKAAFAEQRAEGLADLYKKINDSAAALAKARGYHMVLSSDESVSAKGSYDEVSRIISLKRMLYVDPAMDVTEELIAFMNNEFAVGATAKPK